MSISSQGSPRRNQGSVESLDHIIQLFESRHTSELSDRHKGAIEKLCKEYNPEDEEDGFYYDELQRLAHIIHLSFTSILNQKIELVLPVLHLLEITKKAFKCKKANDQIKEVAISLPIFLNCLCPLLKCEGMSNEEFDFEMIIIQAASVISAIASQGVQQIKDSEQSLHEKKIAGGVESPLQRLYAKGNRNLINIHKSEIPETLVNVLAANSSNSEYLVFIVEAISDCSLYRPIAHKFANMGVLKDLVTIIAETPDFRTYLVRVCIEALWNILEVGDKEIVHAMASEEIVNALKKVFTQLLQKAYKLDDKCLRNEVCILLNYVVQSTASHEFLCAKEAEDDSFLEILLKYATHDELFLMDMTVEDPQKIMFTNKEEDSEFKKLLWTAILYIIRNPENKRAHQYVIEQKFLNALLMYVDPEHSSSALHRLQAPQLKEIQLHALNCISNIILLIHQNFQECNGHLILIRFLSQYTDFERRFSCMKALLYASVYDVFKREFAEEGVMDILLDIIQNVKDNPMELREYAFHAFSNICKSCRPNQKEFRRKNGIELIKENLLQCKKDTSDEISLLNSEESGDKSTFLLAVLDCLWNVVFNNKRSEHFFLDIGGVYLLLDLLEQCDEIHKRILLSSLCSILENPKAAEFFEQWNSAKTTINASQLLIRLYMEEDNRYGVKYETGILVNTDRPLTPKQHPAEIEKDSGLGQVGVASPGGELESMDSKMGGTMSSVHMLSAITQKEFKSKYTKKFKEQIKAHRMDPTGKFSEAYIYNKMLETAHTFDLRSTIFAVFYRVGFDRHELTPEERQRMEIIQIFPFLKNGELWQDIKYKLGRRNIKPTMDDGHWLETSIEEAKEHAEKALYNQTLHAEEIKFKQEKDLENYYNAIRLKNSAKAQNAIASAMAAI